MIIYLQAFDLSNSTIRNLIGYTIVTLIFLSMYSIWRGASLKNVVNSHWHHRFEKFPFAPTDFYTKVCELIRAKKVPEVHLSYINYAQGGWFSPKRKYLRIEHKSFVFDICSAPFGDGYFVSWWLGETGKPIIDFFRNYPLIGRLFPKREKTFFEMDAEMMFKETVKVCVKDAIDQLTEANGYRKLTEAEWQGYSRSY